MMKLHYLLSENDWGDLSRHLSSMQPRVLSRSMGDTTITAEVSKVNSPAWRVSMVVTLTASHRGFVQRQHFESVEAARHELATWRMFDKEG